MTSWSTPDPAALCCAAGGEPPAVVVLALLPPCAGARRPDALGAGPAPPGSALPGASALLPTVAAMAGASAPPAPPRYAHPWVTLFRYLRRELGESAAYGRVAFRELRAEAPAGGGPPLVRVWGLTGGPQVWEVRSPRIIRISRRGVYEYGGEANYGQLRDFVVGGA